MSFQKVENGSLFILESKPILLFEIHRQLTYAEASIVIPTLSTIDGSFEKKLLYRYFFQVLVDDLFNLAIILQVDINLARILQETCQVKALTCKILQECVPGSCKKCIFSLYA